MLLTSMVAEPDHCGVFFFRPAYDSELSSEINLEMELLSLTMLCRNICRSETLKDNPAAIDGLAGSLVELQTAAVATPGLELSEPAFEDAIQLVQTVIQNGDSASSIDVVGRVPSLVVSGITTLDQLDLAGSRLASM